MRRVRRVHSQVLKSIADVLGTAALFSHGVPGSEMSDDGPEVRRFAGCHPLAESGAWTRSTPSPRELRGKRGPDEESAT
jgi:hypothetical protein